MAKAQFLCNDEQLLGAVVQAMGATAGTVDKEVRRLGYDYVVTARGIRPARGKAFVQRMTRHRRRARRGKEGDEAEDQGNQTG